MNDALSCSSQNKITPTLHVTKFQFKSEWSQNKNLIFINSTNNYLNIFDSIPDFRGRRLCLPHKRCVATWRISPSFTGIFPYESIWKSTKKKILARCYHRATFLYEEYILLAHCQVFCLLFRFFLWKGTPDKTKKSWPTPVSLVTLLTLIKNVKYKKNLFLQKVCRQKSNLSGFQTSFFSRQPFMRQWVNHDEHNAIL